MKASKFTSVDFFEDLTSSYARRRFFWGFGFFAFLCFLLIIIANTYITNVIASRVVEAVACNFLASTIIIIGFYTLYVYFIGPNLGLREVSPTRPQDIRERMAMLSRDTRRYIFWGRSGSYFRARPLQELDRQSRDNKHHTEIEIVLPDPTDKRLLASYNKIIAALGESPSENHLLVNVIATTVACAILSSNNNYLNIRIFYSKFLPAFRIDMSDSGALLTQDDPAKSALFFEAESEFFEMFRTTIKNEMAVSRSIEWAPELLQGKKIDESPCDNILLEKFGFEPSDEIVSEVNRILLEKRHRYK